MGESEWANNLFDPRYLDSSRYAPYSERFEMRLSWEELRGMSMAEYARLSLGVAMETHVTCDHCSHPVPGNQALSAHRSSMGHHLCHDGETLVADCWGCSDKQYKDTTGRDIGPLPIDWLDELIEHGVILRGRKPYAMTRYESLLTTTETCDEVKVYLENLRLQDQIKKSIDILRARSDRSQKLLNRCYLIIAGLLFVRVGWELFSPAHTLDVPLLIIGFLLVALLLLQPREKPDRG